MYNTTNPLKIGFVSWARRFQVKLPQGHGLIAGEPVQVRLLPSSAGRARAIAKEAVSLSVNAVQAAQEDI